MKVKMILPALTEAKSPFFRPIKYSLFPPLGLATLAAYLPPNWEAEIVDEHVEILDLNDNPDLVVIQVYITNAYRSYAIADHYRSLGAYVCLGGVHVTALAEEAAPHADTIFIGPGEDTWPQFLVDWEKREPQPVYKSSHRTLDDAPTPRRDLIKRHLYLVPNSLVVSRGCPHRCDFCYKEAFFKGGRSFYTQTVDAALAQIETLPGKHLYFLDDHLFGNPHFAESLFDGMQGMNRLWQAAGTVQSVLKPNLLEKARAAGLRSLFIGFESLNHRNLEQQKKVHNLKNYNTQNPFEVAIHRLHALGVMVNASFVFGMDHDDETVFEQTVAWAIQQGIETATFHILTPYPGTGLHQRLTSQGRITSQNWDLYDTRHAVFHPAGMDAETLESGYWQAYRDFYSWGSILHAAGSHADLLSGLRHLAYAGGWKKFEPFWDWVIRFQRVGNFRPFLEALLAGSNRRPGPSQEVPINPELQPIRVPEVEQ
ncbi:MAG: B12-binding domain-containing radical SAM protein [Anaerolineales bacterium]